jgi:hypothetical protein
MSVDVTESSGRNLLFTCNIQEQGKEANARSKI